MAPVGLEPPTSGLGIPLCSAWVLGLPGGAAPGAAPDSGSWRRRASSGDGVLFDARDAVADGRSRAGLETGLRTNLVLSSISPRETAESFW
jgi:hypothetical protein